jgi:hypothetical protein
MIHDADQRFEAVPWKCLGIELPEIALSEKTDKATMMHDTDPRFIPS